MLTFLQIVCDSCRTVQHAQCYGYLGVEEPRSTAFHACYECLLSRPNAKLLARMKRVTQLRQTMHLIMMEGLLEEQDLSDRLTDFGMSAMLQVGAMLHQLRWRTRN